MTMAADAPQDPGSGAAPLAEDVAGWSPFPGLRPFQPDDSGYFYGRDIEADEVVARLRSKRFVAVIGGSGSGKSSLVLAGAIPRLRTYAIKDAGDFWAPVVATPGTNHVDGDTPIRRLARKFCRELEPVADEAARLEACVAVLREPDGLGVLVERYGSQLRVPVGVSGVRLQLNVLFLLDQFEELFHPSNTRAEVAADCCALVNRIVEQFKKPHPQVCVALTMRSEHLNDCPRYEDLPDAINGASYLVKRLDADELRSAIEQPVLRYLRRHVAQQRLARRQARVEGQAAPAEPLPTDIPIDEALIQRLLTDLRAVMAQQDHADHLPLLQHALFWIWHEASARCSGRPLVDALTLDDLWCAVGALPGASIQPLDASINTLELCLKQRCESIYCRSIDEQPAWEAVFRSLAFKEPNTGTYTQQRAAMASLCRRLNIVPPDFAALARHVQPWMQPHGYLHWDVESSTVKVAHETLIRRWPRLRAWIDEEDRQFHIYLRLLEDTERWKAAPQSSWALSGGDTLRRYEDEQMPALLKDPARVERIDRLLAMDRAGARLSPVSKDALRFLELSIESRRHRDEERRQAEEEKRRSHEALALAERDNDVERANNAELRARAQAEREKARRVRVGRASLAIMLLVLAPLTIWALTVYVAEKRVASKERTLDRSYALAAESQVRFQPQFKDFSGAQDLLRYALLGSHFFDRGRRYTTGPATWPWVESFYADRLKALQSTERFSEARNIASLRTILQGGVWQLSGGTPGAGAGTAAPCSTVQFGDAGGEARAEIATFMQRPGARDDAGLIFVSGMATKGNVAAINLGRREANGRCTIERQLLSTPPQQPTRVGISSDAANIVIAFPGYTQFHSVVWDAPTGVYTRPRATVSTELSSDFREGVLASTPGRFWTDVALTRGLTVRLFDVEPTSMGADVGAKGQALRPRDPASKGGDACAQFAGADDTENRATLWEPTNAPAADERAYCLRTTPIDVTQSAYSATTTLYSVSLFAATWTQGTEERAKDLPLIDQLPLGDRAPREFRLETNEGWLAYTADASAWRAVPWSLDAYRAMAAAVLVETDDAPTITRGGGTPTEKTVALKPAAKPGTASAAPVPPPSSAPASAATPPPTAKSAPGKCARSRDDPQVSLPFALILGAAACPSDAELKARR